MCYLSSGHLLGQTAKCSSESRNSSTNSLNQDGEINIYIFHRFYHRMLFTSPRITNLCKYNDKLHEKGQKTECIVTRSQKSPKSVTKEVENHKNMCPLSIPQNHKRVCFFRPLNHKKVYPSTQSHKRVYQKVYPPDPDPLSTPPSFCPITTCCPCIAAACTAVGATPAQTFEHLCQ